MSMLDSFLLLVVSHWVSYEGLSSLQDGAPPRFAFPVRAWLDSHFPGRCMGRRGSVELPPCDVFSCAWSNEEVCRSKPRTEDELEEQIRILLPLFLCTPSGRVSSQCLRVCRSVCKSLEPVLKSNTQCWCYGLKWCKNCRNVAFC